MDISVGSLLGLYTIVGGHLGWKMLYEIVAIEGEEVVLSGWHGSSFESLNTIIFSSIKGGFAGAGSSPSSFKSCKALDIDGRNDEFSCKQRSAT